MDIIVEKALNILSGLHWKVVESVWLPTDAKLAWALNAVSSDIDAAKFSRSSNKTMDDQMPADLVVLYQDAFKHFDSDNSGIISTKMLGPLLRYCGENPSEAEIQV